MKQSHFVVIGGGLSGSLMTIMLGKAGYKVDLYEKRPDMRDEQVNGGRSINLALSHRGLLALDKVNLSQKVQSLLIPMKGRLIHDLEGNIKLQPYGKDDSEVINSISRVDLNKLLLDEAEKIDNVTLYFKHECLSYDNRSNELTLLDEDDSKLVLYPEAIIAADGATSAVRTSMLKMGRFNYSQTYMDYGYKELEIPPGDDNSFRIESHGLHIWPRDNFVMIALPNPDKSFTLTLFAPFKGENGFSNLKTDDQIEKFFSTNFPDAVKHMPNLIKDMNENPTGRLVTILCEPWNKGNAVLIGDAAHAIIPFYGQGMNAAFEDVRVLVEMIEKSDEETSWKKITNQFSKERKPNTDAIAKLSYDNFIEMRDGVADEKFLERKEVELQLYEKYDGIISKYAMVTFHPEMGYKEAKRKGDILESVITDFQNQYDTLKDAELEMIYNTILAKF